MFKPEEIKLASIGTLTGILSQSIIGNTSSSTVYYYLNDHLGTPQVITDEDGEVVWRGDYRPFGEATVNPDSIVNSNFRFPGQYYDQETGLHYNWHRYYDPRVGRYLRPDPIGYLGGINLYAYCSDDPVNWIDPTGEILGWVIPGAGIVAVSVFIYQAYKAYKKGEEVRKLDEKLYGETDKGFPDPEHAEKLKEDADKAEKEFLEELEETFIQGAACAY
jgi:RHS repeat-associated protein